MQTPPFLTLATELARKAHEGQMRRGLDEPYIVHPMRVARMAAEAGFSDEVVAAAVLHDVVEDTPLELVDLENYLFPRRTVELVNVLSKWWPDDLSDRHPRQAARYKKEYYARILSDPDATALKLLDRTDNLRDATRMVERSPRWRKWAFNYHQKTLPEFSLFVQTPHVRLVTDLFEALAALAAALNLTVEPTSGIILTEVSEYETDDQGARKGAPGARRDGEHGR